MRYRASPAQRELIRRRMQAAELGTRTVSLMHQAVLLRSGLWGAGVEIGKPMDELLDSLTTGQAHSLIDALSVLHPDAKGNA